MRRLLRILLALVLMVGAATLLWRPVLFVQRESYVLLESAGVIDPLAGLWGQILGHNIPRHPGWMRWAVHMVGTIPLFPALGACLLLARGRPRDDERTRWRRLLRCIGLSCVVYAVASASMHVSELPNQVRQLAFELGKSLGCSYFQSGAVAIGPRGPFMGGEWSSVCNTLWSKGPWVTIAGASFAAALLPFVILEPRARRRLNACAACGYDLTGLAGGSCPECGRMPPKQTP